MNTETIRASRPGPALHLREPPVRGHWVRARGSLARAARSSPLSRSWSSELLGQAVAASVLLAATLKFRGTLTFQLQGNGAVKLLVAQCTHDFRLRAVARYDEEAVLALAAHAARGTIFRQLAGSEGRVTVTVEAEENSTRYQGIVPLAGDSLAASLETYFASSEQLPDARRPRRRETAGRRHPGAEASGARGARGRAAGGRRLAGSPARHRHARLRGAAARPGSRRSSARTFRVTTCACSGAPRCTSSAAAARAGGGVLRALGAEEIRDVLREQGRSR